MNKRIKGSPFILSSFNVQQSLYLNDFKHGRANSTIKGGSGGALRTNKNSVIKASLGEHLERLAAVKNYKKKFADQFNPMIPGFHLVTGEVVDLPAEKLFFNFDLPMFNFIPNKGELFNDSCGLAAHVQSLNAIKSGFNEFIERQSLIYNWLSESTGIQINLMGIDKLDTNDSLKRILQIAMSYSDKMYAFDISIIDGMYVVLTIGHNGAAFASGLGTDSNLLIALESSLNEYLMILDSCINIKFNPQQYHSDNIYSSHFYSMDVDDFLDQFNYLINHPQQMNVTSVAKEKNLGELIKDAHNKFQLNIYACFMPFPLKNINVKVVKVYSPEAYPHIWTKIFNPLDFEISKQLPSTPFPNKFRPIPFA